VHNTDNQSSEYRLCCLVIAQAHTGGIILCWRHFQRRIGWRNSSKQIYGSTLQCPTHMHVGHYIINLLKSRHDTCFNCESSSLQSTHEDSQWKKNAMPISCHTNLYSISIWIHLQPAQVVHPAENCLTSFMNYHIQYILQVAYSQTP